MLKLENSYFCENVVDVFFVTLRSNLVKILQFDP